MFTAGVDPFPWFYRQPYLPGILARAVNDLPLAFADLDPTLLNSGAYFDGYCRLVERVFGGRAQVVVSPWSITLDIVDSAGDTRDLLEPVGPWYEVAFESDIVGSLSAPENIMRLRHAFFAGLLMDASAWMNLVGAVKVAVQPGFVSLTGTPGVGDGFYEVWYQLMADSTTVLNCHEEHTYVAGMHSFELLVGPVLLGTGNHRTQGEAYHQALADAAKLVLSIEC